MDSSVSPTHGEQEMSVWNGRYACTCYHPLFVFNQFGDLERCVLRPGNVHSVDGWESALKPVIGRYEGPDGRSRDPTPNVPGDFAADWRTTAAATTSASMTRTMIMRSRATNERTASNASKNRQIGHSAPLWGTGDDGNRPRRQAVLPKTRNNSKIHPGLGFIWGIPVTMPPRAHLIA
jgi:hypothetical protein